MIDSSKYASHITDFIYNNPEAVAVLLEKYGYSVSIKNKRLTTILNEFNIEVFKQLYSGNEKFSYDLAELMISEGYLYSVGDAVASGTGGGASSAPVIGAIVSLGSSIISAFSASSQAKKQRALQANIASAQISNSTRLGYETIKTQAETDVINNISSNLSSYRSSLNEQSTKRQSGTIYYLIAIGGTLVLFYLLSKKAKK